MEVESYLCGVCSKYRDMFAHVLYWLCLLPTLFSDVSQCLETFPHVFGCIFVELVNSLMLRIYI